MKILVRNETSGEVLGNQVMSACSSAERRRGLLSRNSLQPGEGLWIAPCEGVHSAGMKFSIDVLHLDKQKRVRKICSAMKPWRISICLTAKSVLELPAGTAARTRTQKGDQLVFSKQ
ncbi:MAG: DUF192 domain-containing protein [Acidobacteriota bacterium]|nr:DUF192 domain-containing protein [Acidobacteriota bacterium]